MSNKRFKKNHISPEINVETATYIIATINEVLSVDKCDALRKTGYEILERFGDKRYFLKRIPTSDIDTKLNYENVVAPALESIRVYKPINNIDLTRYLIYDIGLHEEIDVGTVAKDLIDAGCTINYANQKRSKIRAKLTEDAIAIVSDGNRIRYCEPYIEPRLA